MTDPRTTENRKSPRHKTPRWVEGFLIAATVLVAFAVMHLSGRMAMNHTP